jgi:hypothetical protein
MSKNFKPGAKVLVPTGGKLVLGTFVEYCPGDRYAIVRDDLGITLLKDIYFIHNIPDELCFRRHKFDVGDKVLYNDGFYTNVRVRIVGIELVENGTTMYKVHIGKGKYGGITIFENELTLYNEPDVDITEDMAFGG